MRNIVNAYQRAFKGLSPSVWWLSLVMLINRSGMMVLPFMTLYLTKKMHYTIGQAGIVLSLFGLGSICGAYFGGALTDKIGFYRTQLLGLISGGIMFLALGQVHSYLWICVLSFILSFFNDTFRPANSAAIAHYSKEENRTRSYSLNRLAINVGWSAGGAIGGFVAAHNYHLLFWIDGLTNMGAAILLGLLFAPAKNREKMKHEKKVVAKKYSAYRDKLYLLFIFLTILYSYCYFQLFTTVPVFYARGMHLDEQVIGILMAVNGLLIALFEMVIITRLEGRRNILHYIFIGCLISGVSFLLLNIPKAGIFIAVLSMLFISYGEILSMPFMNTFWINRSNDNNRGQYAALYSMSWSIAQVVAPGTAGWVAEYLGFNILWWIIGGICAITGICFKLMQRYSR